MKNNINDMSIYTRNMERLQLDLLKSVPQHYCSLVMFREVFLRTKFTEKRESEREILRMHEFCVTRNVLL